MLVSFLGFYFQSRRNLISVMIAVKTALHNHKRFALRKLRNILERLSLHRGRRQCDMVLAACSSLAQDLSGLSCKDNGMHWLRVALDHLSLVSHDTISLYFVHK
jgi:hypothetical protein